MGELGQFIEKQYAAMAQAYLAGARPLPATDKTNGTPYVQYNSALNPGSNVTLILEFFVPDRKPFTNSLEVIDLSQASAGTNYAGTC